MSDAEEGRAARQTPVSSDWHLLPLRVYYEDTDAGGVVYHARYLAFAERGRTELMRSLGHHMGEVVAAGGGFVVRGATLDYKAPARLDDLVTVASRVSSIGRSSLTMLHEVRRGAEILVRITLGLVWIGADFKPKRLPDEIRRVLGLDAPAPV